MATEHRSFCRICAAACGIVVTVEGETVVKVRGDAEHPVSRGYTCAKGRGIPAWHHGPDRLDRPVLRGKVASWDDVLDDLGAAVGAIRTEHGADALALYLATGMAYDSAGQVASAMWLFGTGSTSFYTAATVDNAPVLVAAQLVAGNPMLNPVWEPGNGGPVLFVGSNPVVAHGYGTTLPDPVRHLRDHKASGGTVWVVDPRRTETASLADRHLAARPGTDVELLAALAAGLLRDGADAEELSRWCRTDEVEALRAALAPFSLARAAEVTGLQEADIAELLDELRACDGRFAAFCGTGTTMARDGVLVDWLRWVLLVLTGSLDWSGGMRFNRGAVNRLPPWSGDVPAGPGPASRPDLQRVAGQVPAVALVDEIEAGNVQALVVTGGNPLTALPEPDRVRAALEQLEVLAVVDVAGGELVDLATHVLPATGQLERADLTLAEHVSLTSGMQATRAVVAPGGERRPTWWILGQLARRHGGDILFGADPDHLTDELFLSGMLGPGPLDPDEVWANGPVPTPVAVEHGWVHDTMLPDGRWRIAPAVLLDRLAAREASVVGPGAGPDLVLVPRREMAWSNSVRYAGDGAEPELRLHPDDAVRHGLVDGGRSVVASAHGEVLVAVALDDGVRPGTVSLTHGRAGASAGTLTSRVVDVDPLTGMPLASGLPVTLTPA